MSEKSVLVKLNSVAAALSKSGLEKLRKNAQQGYAYRGIDDVLNTLSAPLASAGLVLRPRYKVTSASEKPSKSGGTIQHVTLEAFFDAIDSASGESFTFGPIPAEAMDTSDKAIYKAMSMAFKYWALLSFCVPLAGLVDADQETPEPAAQFDVAAWVEKVHAAEDQQTLMTIWEDARSAAEKAGDLDGKKIIYAAVKSRASALKKGHNG